MIFISLYKLFYLYNIQLKIFNQLFKLNFYILINVILKINICQVELFKYPNHLDFEINKVAVSMYIKIE